MKKKTLLSVLLLAIFASTMVFTACKKENEEILMPESTPTVEYKNLTPDKTNVNQLEMVTITSDSITLDTTIYAGIIGGTDVSIAAQDNKLIFIMPDIEIGTQTLLLSISGTNYKVNFVVLKTDEIINPDAYITNSINDFTYSNTELTNLINSTSGMHLSEYDNENLTILNNYSANLQTELNQASAEDKLILAKYISANPEIFNGLEDLTQYIDSLSKADIIPEERIEELRQEFENRVINIATFVTVGATLSLATMDGYVFLVSAAAVAYKIYALNKFLIIAVNKNVYQTALMVLNTELKSNIEFANGTEKIMSIESNYRNLNNQDINSSYSTISSIVSSLNTFEGYWNTIVSFLPTALVGGSCHIKDISSENQKLFNVSTDYVTITNVSNSNITVNTTNTLNNLSFTFSTTETSNQDFTFDLVYNNSNVSTSTTSIDATLTVETIPEDTTNYSYDGEEVNVNGQIWMKDYVDGVYTWHGALNACPDPWHLPSEGEMLTYISYVDTCTNCGTLIDDYGDYNFNSWSSTSANDTMAYIFKLAVPGTLYMSPKFDYALPVKCIRYEIK